MQRKQLKQNPGLFKAFLMICIAWIFIASAFVYADRHYYTYPSIVIKENRNKSDINERGTWRYQEKIHPDFFYGNENPYLRQYRYPPPIQKPGTNPFFK